MLSSCAVRDDDTDGVVEGDDLGDLIARAPDPAAIITPGDDTVESSLLFPAVTDGDEP